MLAWNNGRFAILIAAIAIRPSHAPYAPAT